ncbi:MAG: M3 family metallopeptidase [bacterium]
MSDLTRFLDDFAERYLELHHTKEQAFWETRMGLADRHRELSEADLALRAFLGDAASLKTLRGWKERGTATPAEDAVLDGWILMLSRNQVEDEEARTILKQIVEREADLEQARGQMDLGYRDAAGVKVRASSVALSNHVRTNPDADVRHAAFEGLRTIETFALEHGYLEIVRLRNRFARRLGYEDFYDYKVQWAEGFDKATLFRLLDDLESRTRARAQEEASTLRARDGASALEPWNFSYRSWGGAIQAERDPYLRFEDAVERWVRSFAALGIRFRNARVTLDLIDRKGKYENGFMHGPTPAFLRRGEWLPAEINFTANALPSSPGAGARAAQTLFHEGGHAAHFANIVTGAPCFSQEFAPTSTSFAETQSMFCDRLLDDADWRVRYARDDAGKPMAFELIEREIRATHPFAAHAVRNLLVVCYAEKALYELPERDLEPATVLRAFREVETRLTLLPGGCPRPTLAVPHLLSWESSAYYHGYVLATMAVAATRAHFHAKYGRLVDNPAIGRDLAEIYWRPGNSRPFLELIAEMTGRPFSADALAEEVSRPTDEVVRRARKAAEAAQSAPESAGPIDLDLRLRIIHGKETVVEETRDALAASRDFRRWVGAKWPRDPRPTAV